MKKLNCLTILDVPTRNEIEYFKLFAHLKIEAKKDNIEFEVKMFDGKRHFHVGKYWYDTPEAALRAIQAYQAQIAPSKAVRP